MVFNSSLLKLGETSGVMLYWNLLEKSWGSSTLINSSLFCSPSFVHGSKMRNSALSFLSPICSAPLGVPSPSAIPLPLRFQYPSLCILHLSLYFPLLKFITMQPRPGLHPMSSSNFSYVSALWDASCLFGLCHELSSMRMPQYSGRELCLKIF